MAVGARLATTRVGEEGNVMRAIPTRLILIVISFVVFVAAGREAISDDWRPTTDSELRNYIVDSTLFLQTNFRNDMAIYYDANGTYRGKIDRFNWGVEVEGKWMINGNEFCTIRGVGTTSGEKTCHKYVTNGKKVRAENRSVSVEKRVRGNKLP